MITRLFTLCAVALVGACAGSTESGPSTETAPLLEAPGVAVPATWGGHIEQPMVRAPRLAFPTAPVFKETLELHEWGTFTSVQSPAGDDMLGLHHEEEPLPGFVHGRGTCWGAKCVELVPDVGVTQKMETPVIYFHGRHDAPITVTVGFPQGVISQWYPNAASFLPAIGSLDATQPMSGGSMTWTVELDPEGYSPPEVDPNGIWAPSRNVDSRPLRAGGEDEGFIFYRGLGSFSLPIRTQSDGSGMAQVTNGGDEAVPAAFLLRVTADDNGSRGAIEALGGIEAGQSKRATETPALVSFETFLEQARVMIHAALVKSGLRADESWAMVDTWTVSYFHTPGLRVLYVVPRTWTDAILPLEVDVPMDRIVRTLVGRIELTTATEVATIRDAARESMEAGVYPSQASYSVPALQLLGRHAEPKLRAAAQGLPAGELQAWLLACAESMVPEG